jgi:hypothetical protein
MCASECVCVCVCVERESITEQLNYSQTHKHADLRETIKDEDIMQA